PQEWHVLGAVPEGRLSGNPARAQRQPDRAHWRHRVSGAHSATAPIPKARAAETLGVHSEVGKLRVVLVCRPGLAHQRLTPGNRAELLFDDIPWVQEAQRDHFDFVLKMRDRGVEVIDLHELLTETLAIPEAKAWVLDRRITANDVGPGTAPVLRAWLEQLP